MTPMAAHVTLHILMCGCYVNLQLAPGGQLLHDARQVEEEWGREGIPVVLSFQPQRYEILRMQDCKVQGAGQVTQLRRGRQPCT